MLCPPSLLYFGLMSDECIMTICINLARLAKSRVGKNVLFIKTKRGGALVSQHIYPNSSVLIVGNDVNSIDTKIHLILMCEGSTLDSHLDPEPVCFSLWCYDIRGLTISVLSVFEYHVKSPTHLMTP